MDIHLYTSVRETDVCTLMKLKCFTESSVVILATIFTTKLTWCVKLVAVQKHRSIRTMISKHTHPINHSMMIERDKSNQSCRPPSFYPGSPS